LCSLVVAFPCVGGRLRLRLAAVGGLKRYSKACFRV
jgi:hypothetical protein